MPYQNQDDFYINVEDFILNASLSSKEDNSPLNQEIRLFLLTLVNHYKKQEME